ncbi:MAG: MBL fold metallo-hydrolase [Anaerolineales bacterium]|nr:MBL fold metallo-hydrolase [Anaerolineales bacterium]
MTTQLTPQLYSPQLTLKFWGVRGSYPVPGNTTLRYGGNTPSLEITARNAEHTFTLIVDAGTGIIGLGRELAQRAKAVRGQTGGHPLEATILFTHLHHDHTQGLPFFTPLMLPSARLTFVLPDLYEQAPQDVLASVMASPMFPIALSQTGSNKQTLTMRETGLLLISPEGVQTLPYPPTETPENTLVVRALRSYAHPQGVLIYRIEWEGHTIVIATDTEGYVKGDQRLIRFARGAEILVHDAQYSDEHYLGLKPGLPATQGFGHSTPAMAAEVAQQAGVGQLILFHHDPNYDDETLATLELQAQKRFPNTRTAREGMELTLGTTPDDDTLQIRKPARARLPQPAPWVSQKPARA